MCAGRLLDHLRVELFVPGGEQRVGDVESLAVQAQLQHLRRTLDTATLDVDRVWLLLYGSRRNTRAVRGGR